jgi:hypothetical protein
VLSSSDSPPEVKACIDCHYYYFTRSRESYGTCEHPNNKTTRVNLVTGKYIFEHTPHRLRYYPEARFCGADGKWWEKRVLTNSAITDGKGGYTREAPKKIATKKITVNEL